MMIDEEFLTSDYENPTLHLKKMLNSAIHNIEYTNNVTAYDILETICCLNAFSEENNFEKVQLDDIDTSSFPSLRNRLNAYYETFLVSQNVNIYSDIFKKQKYEFSDEEYNSIQNTINAIREEIYKSNIFTEEHKERLLNKLEALQKELHKKMHTLEKIQGNIISLGRTFGAFGNDAKPMFDRVNEMLRIVFRVEEKGDNIKFPENQIEYKGTSATGLLE